MHGCSHAADTVEIAQQLRSPVPCTAWHHGTRPRRRAGVRV